MGPLAGIYSTIDSLRRRTKDAVLNPMESLYQGVRNFGSDWDKTLDTQAQAFPSIPRTPEQSLRLAQMLRTPEQARAELADTGANMGMGAATVWHGSPHKFNKFDSSKIGTGEGAQAYGHGLYLAESPDVAKSYAVDPRGALYKVDLPDEHIAKMLDWDKPLSQQAPEVRTALAKLPKGWATGSGGQRQFIDPSMSKGTGGRLLEELQMLRRGRPEELLRQQGIPGIRYLDGGSRGAGQGTSNYVVFPGNEDILKILERNGELVNQLRK